MKATHQDLRYFFTPIVLSILLCIADNLFEKTILSSVTEFLLEVFSSKFNAKAVKLAFYGLLIFLSLKLCFDKFHNGTKDRMLKHNGLLFCFSNAVVLPLSIFTGFVIGQGIYLLVFTGESSNFFFAWGFYFVLFIASFMAIIESSIEAYNMALFESFHKKKKLVARALGFFTLITAIGGVYFEVRSA